MIRTKLAMVALIATFTNGCAAHSTSQIVPDPQMSNPEQEREINPSEKTPAIIVHIDPQTGQIITPPATPSPGQVTLPPIEAAKPPLPPLQESLSPVPGGGVMIELDDRFRTPLTATIDANGSVRFEHKPFGSGANDNE